MVQASIVLLFFFPFLVFLLSPSFSFMGAFSFAFFAGKRIWDLTIQLHSKRERKKCLCVHVSSYWKRSCEKTTPAIPIPLSAAAHKGKRK